MIDFSKRNPHGWVRSPPDPRDFKALAAEPPGGLPARVDLRATVPRYSLFAPNKDQGAPSTCFSMSTSDLLLHRSLASRWPPARASAQFLYWTGRERMGTTDRDSGMVPREQLQALRERGWCDATLCPYRPATLNRRPAEKAFAQAATRTGLTYRAVPQDLAAMKACLAAGRPFLLCFQFTAAFWGDAVAKTGLVPVPRRGARVIGSHGNLCVGYSPKGFILKGTYGDAWAASGDYVLPPPYALDPDWAGDFYTVDYPPAV